MNQPNENETLYAGRFLKVAKRGTWEYVTRPNATGVVAVVAVHDDGRLVLVEQHRPAAGRTVIELPAGLVGDVDQSESMLPAAQRELLEETGYEAAHWQKLTCGYSSAGMTDEAITFFLATGLTKASEGGGVDGENITLHEVPVAQLNQWLSTKMQAAIGVDLKIMAGLWAASCVSDVVPLPR